MRHRSHQGTARFAWSALVAVMFAVLAAPVLAQPLNARWVGDWGQGDERIRISASQVRLYGRHCAIRPSAPVPPGKRCVAAYDGVISRRSLLGDFAARATWSAQDLAVLGSLSDETYRQVVLSGLGMETAHWLILDRETVYHYWRTDDGSSVGISALPRNR